LSSKHRHSGRWEYGMSLSITTAVFWGILPILLVGLFPVMDPLTITFYRFFIASVLLFIWLAYRNNLEQLEVIKNRALVSRILIAALMLSLNYGGYIVALEMMSPAGAQVLIQIAPILLMLSGIFIFHETFTTLQWSGFATFLFGLVIFFWDKILELRSGADQYGLGMLIMFFAAVFWAIYASIQKQLLTVLSSVQLIFLINSLGAVFFFFVSEPSLILKLNTIEILLLIACGVNTLVAYGSFSEALEHWEASKISALFTIVPILTIVFVELANLIPGVHIQSEPISSSLVIGALLVVIGAACTSLGQESLKETPT